MVELTLQELDHRLTLIIEGWKEAQEKVFLGFKDDLQEIKQRITSLEKRLDDRIIALHQMVGDLFKVHNQMVGDLFIVLEQELGARITALDQKIE